MALSRVREELTRQFLEALNQGQLPWHACWQQQTPRNAVTGKQYRGVNTLALSICSMARGYTDPRWCTYQQAFEHSWQVRKGAKSCKVEYWAYYDPGKKKMLTWKEVRAAVAKDPQYQDKLQLRCRTYAVFNASQIDGIPELEMPNRDIGVLRDQRDTLIRNLGIGYREVGDQAYYSPAEDTVTLPPEATFDDAYGYLSTLLHECAHATGHPTRLHRFEVDTKESKEDYAREELRAEIASAFTAQTLELQLSEKQMQTHLQNHSAYIQNWAQILKEKPEKLYRAIKAAEQISDYLIEQGEFLQIGQKQSPHSQTQPVEQASPEHRKFLHEATERGYYPDELSVAPSIPPSRIAELSEQYPWANYEQLGEIAQGGLHGLSQEQLEVFAKPEFSAIQMCSLRYSQQSGLTPDQMEVLANPAFSHIQMDILRAGYQSGQTHQQVALYADPELAPQQMLDEYMAIQQMRLSEPWPEPEPGKQELPTEKTDAPGKISKPGRTKKDADLIM